MSNSRIVKAERRNHAGLVRLGGELSLARRIAGLTLAEVSAATGISMSELSRMERGAAPKVSFASFARATAAVGAEVWFRSYPVGEPLRDIAHVRLAVTFLGLLGDGFAIGTEVPIGDDRDLRAWDMTLRDASRSTCGVEFETKFLDAQAQLRRLHRKVADGGLDRVLLVISDTRANRLAVRAAESILGTTFVIQDPAALAALGSGRIPPRDALLFLRVPRVRRDASD